MNNKGHEFKGMAGGENYKRLAALFGMKEKFYRKGIGSVELDAGMKALDLGCGPGALSFALAEKAHPDSEIIGIDISEDQLNYARRNSNKFQCEMQFTDCSMDELPFPSEHFDIVISSMALHAIPPELRRRTIAETERVLKDKGKFILVDWCKPRFGLWGLVWFPMVIRGKDNKDNWNNVYCKLCEDLNLTLTDDSYINSIARRQVFVKGIIMAG